jgi:hypothetical protein
MLEGPARELLAQRGYRQVTALTDPEVRRRLREGKLQLDPFGEDVVEVQDEGGQRLLLRRIPGTQQRHRSRRADQLAKVRARVAARNEYVSTRTRGHVLVTMLALASQDALDRLQSVRLVSFADPTLGRWRLPTRWLPQQQPVLDVLPPLPPPLLSAQKPTATA